MAEKRKILDDDKIIDMYFARDERAIEATDAKYGQYLYTIAYNIVHDRLDCEECLNDTYLDTWNRIPPTRPNAFQLFLATMMRNIAIDKYRRTNASKRIPSELIVSLEELDEAIGENYSPNEELAIQELERIINEFLQDMNDREQYIFVCRYYYSDRTADIAETLGISQSTVLRELAALRQRLKESLESEGFEV